MSRHLPYFLTKNLPIVKAVAVGLFIILIGFTLKTQLDRMPPQNINAQTFKVLSTPYSLNFFSAYSQDELFKISPFDDYIYRGSQKEHIYNKKSDYEVEKDYLLEMLYLWPPSKNIIWKLRSEHSEMTYRIQGSEYKADILRYFTADTMPESIGQSITFCSDCLVSDEDGRLYFNSEYFSDEKLDVAKNLKLTSLLLSKDQFFPKSIHRIKILDKKGEPKFAIYVNDYQEVYYDEAYHLLEFKTYVSKAGKAFVSQKIDFF